jgi:WD40 repeat protein
MSGHTDRVRAVCAGPSGRLFSSSGSNDAVIMCWNLSTGQCEDRLYGHTDLVVALLCVGPVLVSGSFDGVIRVWGQINDGSKWQCLHVLSSHSRAVKSLVAHPSMPLLFSGSYDTTIRIWDCRSWQCLQVMREHADWVLNLVLWDQYLVSACLDGTIKLFLPDSTKGGAWRVVRTLSPAGAQLTDLCVFKGFLVANTNTSFVAWSPVSFQLVRPVTTDSANSVDLDTSQSTEPPGPVAFVKASFVQAPPNLGTQSSADIPSESTSGRAGLGVLAILSDFERGVVSASSDSVIRVWSLAFE